MKRRDLLQHIQFMDIHPRRSLRELSDADLDRLSPVIQQLYDRPKAFTGPWEYPGARAPQRGWYRWHEFSSSPGYRRTDPLSRHEVGLVQEYVSILAPGRRIRDLTDREVERIVVYLYNIQFFTGSDDYFEMAALFSLDAWGEYPWEGDE